MKPKPRYEVDMYGRLTPVYDTAGMLSPVQCGLCGAVYDAGNVVVTARYSDCSVWISPCCKKQVDDRQFVSLVTARRL